MDEEQKEMVEEQVIEEAQDDVVGRILNNAMPKDIDTEGRIKAILGTQ